MKFEEYFLRSKKIYRIVQNMTYICSGTAIQQYLRTASEIGKQQVFLGYPSNKFVLRYNTLYYPFNYCPKMYLGNCSCVNHR